MGRQSPFSTTSPRILSTFPCQLDLYTLYEPGRELCARNAHKAIARIKRPYSVLQRFVLIGLTGYIEDRRSQPAEKTLFPSSRLVEALNMKRSSLPKVGSSCITFSIQAKPPNVTSKSRCGILPIQPLASCSKSPLWRSSNSTISLRL